MQEMLLARLYSSNGTNEKISLIALGIWDFPWNYGNTFFLAAANFALFDYMRANFLA